MVSVIKGIYQHRKMRIEQGKKSTSSDEHYFQIAENLLYSELGLALQKSKTRNPPVDYKFHYRKHYYFIITEKYAQNNTPQ